MVTRAQKETGLYILSTNEILGHEIVEYYGMVTGCSVMGTNVFKDFTAGLADRVGGRVRGYTRALQSALDNALLDMAKQAKGLGANAIISVRTNTGDMNRTLTQASCIGTAVLIKSKPN